MRWWWVPWAPGSISSGCKSRVNRTLSRNTCTLAHILRNPRDFCSDERPCLGTRALGIPAGKACAVPSSGQEESV